MALLWLREALGGVPWGSLLPGTGFPRLSMRPGTWGTGGPGVGTAWPCLSQETVGNPCPSLRRGSSLIHGVMRRKQGRDEATEGPDPSRCRKVSPLPAPSSPVLRKPSPRGHLWVACPSGLRPLMPSDPRPHGRGSGAVPEK